MRTQIFITTIITISHTPWFNYHQTLSHFALSLTYSFQFQRTLIKSLLHLQDEGMDHWQFYANRAKHNTCPVCDFSINTERPLEEALTTNDDNGTMIMDDDGARLNQQAAHNRITIVQSARFSWQKDTSTKKLCIHQRFPYTRELFLSLPLPWVQLTLTTLSDHRTFFVLNKKLGMTVVAWFSAPCSDKPAYQYLIATLCTGIMNVLE